MRTDPGPMTSAEAITEAVERLGFLPFFRNPIPGFSIAEHTPPALWFNDGVDGPWEWKGPVARSGKCVYGKFFHGRAGFISLDWFPAFANYRRNGYDFDALYDDGFASRKDKEIYDVIAEHGSLLSRDLKQLCGYRRDGKKGFETVVTRLQMESYVIISDFEYLQDRLGREYGWGVARYSTPEAQYGRELMDSAYREAPEDSRRRVLAHIAQLYPQASEKQILSMLGD